MEKNARQKLMALKKTTKDRIWFIATLTTMLIGFAILGPLVDGQINNMKPYMLVTESNYIEVAMTKATHGSCYIPIYKPAELAEFKDNEQLCRVPMDGAPPEMLPYIYYPDNWNSWYNIFNPEQALGPTLRKVFTILNPILAFALLVYAVILWRMGRFKKVIDRLRGNKKKEDKD